MKLYATVTSERATKGQGGNKFIRIEVKDDNREVVAILFLEPYLDEVGDGIKAYYCFADHVYAQDTGSEHNEIKGNCSKCKNTQYSLNDKTGEMELCPNHEKGKRQKGKCMDSICINHNPTMESVCDNCKD